MFESAPRERGVFFARFALFLEGSPWSCRVARAGVAQRVVPAGSYAAVPYAVAPEQNAAPKAGTLKKCARNDPFARRQEVLYTRAQRRAVEACDHRAEEKMFLTAIRQRILRLTWGGLWPLAVILRCNIRKTFKNIDLNHANEQARKSGIYQTGVKTLQICHRMPLKLA